MKNTNWVTTFNDGNKVVLSHDTETALEEAELQRPEGTDANTWLTLWPVSASYNTDEYVVKVQNVFSSLPHTVVKDAKWLAENAPKHSRIRNALRKLFSRRSISEVVQDIIVPTYAGTDEEVIRQRRFYDCGYKVEVADTTYRVEVWKDAGEAFVSFTPKEIAEEKTTFLRISDDKGRE
jgi:hypothetical protein